MKCIYAEKNANEIFTVTASPALFVIVIYSVGFPKKTQQATDMQRNHAGSETEINYV